MISSSGETGRVFETVNKVFNESSREGERAVAWVRLIVGGFAALVWAALTSTELAAGLLSAWAGVVVPVALAVVSLVLLQVLKNPEANIRAVIYVSIFADCAAIATMLAMFSISSRGHGYAGTEHNIGLGFLYLAVVAGGMRFSRKAALFGAVLGLVLFLAVRFLVDVPLHGAALATNMVDFSVALLVLVGVGALAFTTAFRTHRMAVAVANQMIFTDRARDRLGAYTSEDVARRAMEVSGDIEIGTGKRVNIAILFTDLRDFTSMSEGMTPEEVLKRVNDYLELMVAVIHKHGGTVDKFIGDAIMAHFGAATPKSDDAVRAIRCAAAMRAALAEHNMRRATEGLGPLKHGVGVHYGSVIYGNVGTSRKVNATILGDAVNLASRLESSTKSLGVDTLYSKELLDAAGEDDEYPPVRPVGTIEVKGRKQPVEVYTLAA